MKASKGFQLLTDLLNLVIEQNDMLKENNQAYHDVLQELDAKYKEFEKKVAGLRERIMKIKTDMEGEFKDG